MTVNYGLSSGHPRDENEDCPQRGVALSHMRTPSIIAPTCQFCGVRLFLGRTLDGNLTPDTTTPASTEVPGFDVAARLRQLGLMPATMGDISMDAFLKTMGVADETLVEPKAITGQGPQGPATATRFSPPVYGRGPLTDGDKRRLEFHVYKVRNGLDESPS